ncbi:tetracycline resistance protein tetM [Paenibacillus albiflavus]|uniref:Tetracycline resistance protein tetM n=1 Tax=Paenibacillus albiflavus TaxID=2545760 RepID=A0A4V2WPX0_9BACL|nr:tetracycline resistance protein tetM [Paenibacillus albiflavus]
MRQFNNIQKEHVMNVEKRIILYENYEYRDSGACRRWKDKSG